MKKLKDLSVREPGFEVFLDPEFDTLKEYKTMLKLLSLENTFKITDCKQHIADEKGNPVTFGGVEVDADGTIFPIETVLVNKHDLMLEQSIDYIFQFERNSGYKSPPIKTEESKNPFASRDDDYSKQGATHSAINGSQDLQDELKKFSIVKDSVKVEKFQITGQKYLTLSDHFGVSVELKTA